MKEDNKLADLLTLITLGIVRFFSVPQGHCRIITQWGKFVGIANPGLNSCLSFWGFYRKPAKLVPMLEQVRDYEEEVVFTKDGVEVEVDTVIFFSINDPYKAVFEVEDYELAIRALVQSILRNECGNLSTREVFSSRKDLAESIKKQLSQDTQPWGISVRLVEIKGLKVRTKEV